MIVKILKFSNQVLVSTFELRFVIYRRFTAPYIPGPVPAINWYNGYNIMVRSVRILNTTFPYY
jgi:hypothetical protein